MVKSMQKQLNHFFRRFLNKRYRLHGQVRGFTLLELLIASVIGVLIVGTMMTFVFSVSDTDRKEAAKATSQEEIQAALDYIADDMREAVYIYDGEGLNPPSPFVTPGIGNSLPNYTNALNNGHGVPVLVFWKRYIYQKDKVVFPPGYPSGRPVACLPQASNVNCSGGDIFRYSLVAYYLVKNNTNPNWSNTARIVRFELKDGISTSTDTAGRLPCIESVKTNCPAMATVTGDTNNYYITPDTGFKLFSLTGSGGSIKSQMNAWGSIPGAGTGWSLDGGDVLVDFIDDTAYDATPYAPPVLIPFDTVNASGQVTASSCDGENGLGAASVGSQRIPGRYVTDSITGKDQANKMTGFYVCVNSTNSVARIYLRGNAQARLNPNFKSPTTSNTPFFPSANLTVFARGILNPI
jgi:type II secretory pathway pseudopilin PulG